MCASEGIKFRYCRICRMPVARRNFRSRHMHDQHIVWSECKVKNPLRVRVRAASSSSHSSAGKLRRHNPSNEHFDVPDHHLVFAPQHLAPTQ